MTEWQQKVNWVGGFGTRIKRMNGEEVAYCFNGNTD